MKIPVEFKDPETKEKKVIEVEVHHTLLAKGKEIYRSSIFTHPFEAKRIYVEFDPETKKVEIKEV